MDTAVDAPSTSFGDLPVEVLESGSLTYKVVLVTTSPGLLHALTVGRENLRIEAYPLGPLLVLQARGAGEELEETRTTLEARTSVAYSIPGEGTETFVLQASGVEEEVLRMLADHDVHVMPPVRWSDGKAHLTLLVSGTVDLRQVEALFPDARLLSKRTIAKDAVARHALRSPLFLSRLTRKQAGALVAAFEGGYYDFPRRATMEEISRAVGAARSTFQEHLHKAEQHVVRAMLPLVRIRAAGEEGGSASPGEALSLYSRFSGELGLYVQLEVLGSRVRSVELTSKPSSTAGTSHPYLDQIVEYVRSGTGDLREIPLDLHVGPFESEVLRFLRTLPRGETITYGDIARELGRPNAARAVGKACARNPAPLVIPCHRVLPASGGLGGYTGEGGTKTKRKLLVREGAIAPTDSENQGAPGEGNPTPR